MISVLFLLGYCGVLTFIIHRFPLAQVDVAAIQKEIILPSMQELVNSKDSSDR